MVPAIVRHVSWLTLWALSLGRLDGSLSVAWSCAIARTGMTRVCNNEAAVLHLDEEGSSSEVVCMCVCLENSSGGVG